MVVPAGSHRVLPEPWIPRGRPIAIAALLLAVVYAISYTGSAVPNLVAGQASRVLSLPLITAGYAVLAGLVWLATLFAARNPDGGR